MQIVPAAPISYPVCFRQGFEKWRKSDKCREVWDRESEPYQKTDEGTFPNNIWMTLCDGRRKKAHEQVRRESSTTVCHLHCRCEVLCNISSAASSGIASVFELNSF